MEHFSRLTLTRKHTFRSHTLGRKLIAYFIPRVNRTQASSWIWYISPLSQNGLCKENEKFRLPKWQFPSPLLSPRNSIDFLELTQITLYQCNQSNAWIILILFKVDGTHLSTVFVALLATFVFIGCLQKIDWWLCCWNQFRLISYVLLKSERGVVYYFVPSFSKTRKMKGEQRPISASSFFPV